MGSPRGTCSHFWLIKINFLYLWVPAGLLPELSILDLGLADGAPCVALIVLRCLVAVWLTRLTLDVSRVGVACRVAQGAHLDYTIALPCPALPCSALPCPTPPCPALPCPALLSMVTCEARGISDQVPLAILQEPALVAARGGNSDEKPQGQAKEGGRGGGETGVLMGVVDHGQELCNVQQIA